MKRRHSGFVWSRAVGASMTALCLVASSAMSSGMGKQRLRAHNSGYPISSLPSGLAEVLGPVSNPVAPKSGSNTEVRARINEAYGKLPMSFEANAGQAADDVKFIARVNHQSVLLTSDGAVIALRQPFVQRTRRREGMAASLPAGVPKFKLHNLRSATLRFKFAGASASPHIYGLDRLPGTSNFLRGNDPQQWRANIATYAKVKYESLYPGVDLIYYGNQRLEYDLILAPGADPGAITFEVWGASTLTLDHKGALVAQTPAGDLRHEKPLIYQETDGVKHLVAGRYVMREKRRVGFKIGAYDANKPLVIDPKLKYAFKFGGSSNDQVTGIAVDSQGNAYVMGQTMSSDFPTKNPISGTLRGQTDAFVTKLNASGDGMVYSTYLGGSQSEFSGGIAVDSSGSAYVTGLTFSTDFPTTAGAFQTHSGGSFDAFVAKLSPDGNGLVYSTFLGGSQGDGGSGITVDSAGNAYVTGVTGSVNFPTMNPLQPAPGFSSFGSNAFVTKLNAAGSALVYSSYLGGSGGAGGSSNGDRGNGIAVDGAGNAYVAGTTASTNFPTTAGAFRTAHGGGVFDAFVTKVNAAGALSYSTYVGGSGNDFGAGIAVDGSGKAYVTGATQSTNFPTANAFQTTAHGSLTAFVTELNASGSSLVYSTYLGGSGGESGNGIAVDSAGSAYVVGTTSSTDFPTASPLQTTLSGPSDVFLAQVSPGGGTLLFSSYLGGNANDNGNAIALDATGSNAYLGITSNSAAFTGMSADEATQQDDDDDDRVAKVELKQKCQSDIFIVSVTYPPTVTFGTIFQVTVGVKNLGPDKEGHVEVTLKGTVDLLPLDISVRSQSECTSDMNCVMDAGQTKEITMAAVVVSLGSTKPDLPLSVKFDVRTFGRDCNGDNSVSKPLVVIDNPSIDSARVVGKQLIVHVKNSPPSSNQELGISLEPEAGGPVIVLNGEDQKTRPDDQDPTNTFVAKKAGKYITPGDTVKLQVRFPDGTLTPEFSFTRPQ